MSGSVLNRGMSTRTRSAARRCTLCPTTRTPTASRSTAPCPSRGGPARRCSPSCAAMADRGGRRLGDRQGLRDDVLRRPRALRLHERGVRARSPTSTCSSATSARSATKFEGEIIAMTLDLFHADAVTDGEPAGLVTTGGTGSILHAVLAYREHGATPRRQRPAQLREARDRATRPSTRPATCFGVECRDAPGRPRHHAGRPSTPMADRDRRPDHRRWSARPATTATAPSTRSRDLGELALERRASACTSTAASAASSSRSARSSATTSRCSTSGSPASPASRPTRTSTATPSRARSTLLFRDKALRNGQYFFVPGWSGGKYMSPGIEGSRSGGLLAATWASMVQLGRDGYRALRRGRSSRPPTRDAGRRPVAPRAADHGQPDVLLLLHLRRVRHLPRQRLHAAATAGASTASSTRTRSTWPSPARRPSPAWSRRSQADLADAVAYARSSTRTGSRRARARIYGGVAGGLTDEADEFIAPVMAGMLDAQQAACPRERPE